MGHLENTRISLFRISLAELISSWFFFFFYRNGWKPSITRQFCCNEHRWYQKQCKYHSSSFWCSLVIFNCLDHLVFNVDISRQGHLLIHSTAPVVCKSWKMSSLYWHQSEPVVLIPISNVKEVLGPWLMPSICECFCPSNIGLIFSSWDIIVENLEVQSIFLH